MARNFVAVDLGASSGRVVLGRLEDGRLALTELHRFENVPVTEPSCSARGSEAEGDSLRWDIETLRAEVLRGVEIARARLGAPPDGVACDSWGVDYVLLNAEGAPLARPFHYRDRRTEGVMEDVCKRIGRFEIFKRTGVQFLPFNTIYQLAAEDRGTLRRSGRILMIADYFNHVLGGEPHGEVTLASTTQLVDPRTRQWDPDLTETLQLYGTPEPNVPGFVVRKFAGRLEPVPLLPRLVEAGTYLGDGMGFPVYASASHDTAAAVAGCPGTGDDWAFLSSGTWSLLGVELTAPVVTQAALDANLSNELGVCGTTRLLKNIMGLWPLQQCREEWRAAGVTCEWPDILALAEKAPPLAAVIDPDDRRFLGPGDMQAKIAEFCRETAQTPPASVGETARVILEALALKCRLVLEDIERVTGRALRVIHMVGGGVQNRLLCQFTADATGRRVVAGPVEATAAGNVLAQAMGARAVKSLADAREIVRRSFDLVQYDPRPSRAWEDAHGRLTAMIRRPRTG